MTATGPISGVPANSSSNDALLRLERYNRNLLSLEEKLKSYVCEPKTRSLYERMESLKNSLENLKNSNREIISALKDHKLFFEDAKERIREQLETYKALELKVLEYIGMARLHS
jgi:CII-binding regulator of phage lambda lysogenization HflD